MSEWSRSRYWLSFFLYNRHERLRVRWTDEVTAPLPEAAVRWLASEGSTSGGMPEHRKPLIARSVAECSDDPAFVQTLRLIAKEQGFHRQLRGRLAQRFGGKVPTGNAAHATRWAHFRTQLGLRFELSCMLLHDIVELELHSAVESAVRDSVARTACAQIIQDLRAHTNLLTERLTMEYADFNFVRRNLRRYRLRGMFAAVLGSKLLRHRAMLPACGVAPHEFAARCWSDFCTVLERMVPYHRDALLSALLHQREKPYEPAEL